MMFLLIEKQINSYLKAFHTTLKKVVSSSSFNSSLIFALQLSEELSAAREEICDLHKQRDQYEEAMKKAFMRGVCALNLEAMTIFNKDDQKGILLLGQL